MFKVSFENSLTYAAPFLAALLLTLLFQSAAISAGDRATSVSAGGNHTCATTQAGVVWCWGKNWNGQLGNGYNTDRRLPFAIPGFSSRTTPYGTQAGQEHSCGVTSSGSVHCWGFNGIGQLGDGTTASRFTPSAVVFGESATSVAVGESHSCGLGASGALKCWGRNDLGQVGDGTAQNRMLPTSLSSLNTGVAQVSLGLNHGCARTTAGGIQCWGYNHAGQIGNGAGGVGVTVLAPTGVLGLNSGVVAVEAGGNHSCALTQSGSVKCWGMNERGQLGIGTDANQFSPADVVGLTSGITNLSAGEEHTCALTQAGGVKCWGRNNYGQLGDGSTTDRNLPVDVTGLSDVAAISAGAGHTCAVLASGAVQCWGKNDYGQLGNGLTTNRSEPSTVLGFDSNAQTFHVAATGSDTASCGSQNSPCRNIDYAVHKALSGDAVAVAGGTYSYANVANLCAGIPIQGVVCIVNKAITLKGGYTPSTWIHDPANNPTIIDGQNMYRGVFVYSTDTSPTRLTMSHFRIQNGSAQGLSTLNPYDPSAFGGGMSVENAAVALSNITFQNNRAIGANTNDPASAGGAGSGAALSVRSASGNPSSLTNVIFSDNTSAGGQGVGRGGYAFGSLFVYDATVAVSDSVFSGNIAQAGTGTGSGRLNDALQSKADALGAAIAVEGKGNVTLTRVIVLNNEVIGGTATTYGGGAFGGGVFVEDSTMNIADSVFKGNIARAATSATGGMGAGGGLLFFNSNGSVHRSQILANQAFGGGSSPSLSSGPAGGGGIYLWRSSPAASLGTFAVHNTVIASNSASRGQGINIGGGGGGIFIQGLAADLSHVTLADNQLLNGLVVGQAIALIETPGVSSASAHIAYSIISDHSAPPTGSSAVTVNASNTLTFNKGLFFGNSNNTNLDNQPVLPGSINGIATMETVGSIGYLSARPPNNNYHLSQTSAARGKAVGTSMVLDVDNQSKPNARLDMGADEYVSDPDQVQFSASTASVGEGGGSVELLVTRFGSRAGAASVNYSTSNGSATAGSDFSASSGTLNWADWDGSSRTITIPVIDDTVGEASETFSVNLSGSVGTVLGIPTSLAVTITDNDGGLAAVVPPASPSIVSVVPGPGSAAVYFTAPANTGGSIIINYTATCTGPGNTTRTSTGFGSPLTVRGLSGGGVYTCTVAARNAAGTGSSSTPLPVTPLAAKASKIPLLLLLLD